MEKIAVATENSRMNDTSRKEISGAELKHLYPALDLKSLDFIWRNFFYF